MESADHYRQRAVELRRVAEAVSIDSIRDEYRKVADQYEKLAQNIEKAERPRRERED